MKTLIIVSLLLAAAVQGQAQTNPLRAEQQREADAIHARVLDTEAMSWAWRIEKGNLSYSELNRNSANWGRGEEVRSKLLTKVKEIVNKGEVRLLTAKEDKELDTANAQVRAIFSGQRTAAARSANTRAQRQAAIDAAAREMMDVEAKHWAWRIASRRDITFKELKTYSEGWLRGPEVTSELLEKVQTRLQSGETPALSISEMGRMEAGKKKIHNLTSHA